MTVTQLQVGNGLVALPRVNLLPVELVGTARLRRVQVGLAAVFLAGIGVVGLVLSSAAGSVSDGHRAVSAADADQVRVQRQLEGYRDVTEVYARAGRAQSALGVAMGDEIRYSGLLDDLSRAVPGDVWLTSASFARGAAGGGPAAAPGTAGAPAATGAGSSTAGVSVALAGVALSHDDVAAWMDVLARRKGFGRPVLQNQTEARIGDHPVVNWTMSVPLTETARSGRYLPGGS